MIYLETGQPGHGKTLRAMQLALEYQAKGRDVYVNGVRGLNYGETGFLPLPDPRKWQDLPDGAVIVLDECYSSFPRRPPGAKVPDYVEAMATHRHRGFDFILICQQAKQQLDIFILGLIDRHEHIRRKWGLNKSVILWWDKFSENLNDSNTKIIWTFPRDVMKRNIYESTVQDTTQKKIPWYVWALPLSLAALALLLWKVFAFFDPPKPPPAPVAQKPASQAASLGQLGAAGEVEKRPDDIAAWLKPRIEGQPWTARAYDKRPITAAPELYCVAVDDGDCRCITEQGTKYVVDVKICRSIAANGSYNPTRQPVQSGVIPQGQPVAVQGQAMGGQPVGVEGGWPAGVGANAYTPPGTPGTWKADAFGGGK